MQRFSFASDGQDTAAFKIHANFSSTSSRLLILYHRNEIVAVEICRVAALPCLWLRHRNILSDPLNRFPLIQRESDWFPLHVGGDPHPFQCIFFSDVASSMGK